MSRFGGIPRLVPVFVLSAWLGAAGVSALTVTPQSEEELVDRSDVIVRGHCLRTETTRVRGLLMTAAVIRVDEVLKGAPGAEIRVLTPGGVDRDRPVPVRQIFLGVPHLEVGDDVLLFLTSAGDAVAGESGLTAASEGSYFFSDLAQGKVSARPDPTALEELQNRIEQRLGGEVR